ncbi:hypothetical protein [Pseudomonas sp. MS19]|uniref:hypothetical protein n=1 Tax=Pseudomonas sp. MS19 TaxID=2579939 RepID=UPI0015628557|nr:hypothetical protein [Pseudomonas sp. MS19]NRH27050.1 hypothetical protein [Pseudomonas sp. MS19]
MSSFVRFVLLVVFALCLPVMNNAASTNDHCQSLSPSASSAAEHCPDSSLTPCSHCQVCTGTLLQSASLTGVAPLQAAKPVVIPDSLFSQHIPEIALPPPRG